MNNIFFYFIYLAETVRPVDDRIIGGFETSIITFPWQVSLIRANDEHFCGGSIIDRRRIVTAAHCVDDDNDTNNYLVRVGSTNRTSGGYIKRVNKIIVHEQYWFGSADHDIAIIVLKYQLHFSKSVQPISLPLQNSSLADNTTVLVSGWGTRELGNHNLPENLHAVAVQVINQDACRAAYSTNPSRPNPISSNMLCAGILSIGGKDSCQVCYENF